MWFTGSQVDSQRVCLTRLAEGSSATYPCEPGMGSVVVHSLGSEAWWCRSGYHYCHRSPMYLWVNDFTSWCPSVPMGNMGLTRVSRCLPRLLGGANKWYMWNDEHDNTRWYQQFLWITDLLLRNGVWGMSGHRISWAQPLILSASTGPYHDHWHLQPSLGVIIGRLWRLQDELTQLERV